MIEHQALALRDRYAALLRDSLRVLGSETVDQWLAMLEADMYSPEIGTPERLAINAALVGILTVMCDAIEASRLLSQEKE